ncbi:class I SAM-dependent methyltransferase [Nocardioides sp. R-C-SC26]|uniref:class I SAM-dependent methyltransferase n=1 Tax=Nocardioides sp. R-C-SC26 TaxID=2870414 RepID=UPI001E3091DB|nr:class I SAM-dependent methyltransferase [Nocardioides sp. R-C-SC26]
MTLHKSAERTTSAASERWPGLDVVPSGPRAAISARIARRLFTAAVNRLDVTVLLHHEDGVRQLGRGGPTAIVYRPDEFFARIGRHQLIGFGEAYLTGAWDEGPDGDLGGFLAVLAAEISDLVPRSLQRFRTVVAKRPPGRQKSSKKNSQANIAHHYDLSNDLFELFLDPSLSYSAALFAGDPALARREDLEEAQYRKIDRMLDEVGVGQGTRLLEIGSGWGALAIRAARRGATVRTVTLSVEQKQLADQRIAAAGLSDRISVEICDYRDLKGSYDAIVSVEMIEAVGWQYWRTYFETLDRVLAPGGRVCVQAITMPHDRMLATRNTYTWIHKYIFPGGMLPSLDAIDDVTRSHTALRMQTPFSLGLHYVPTLRFWDEAFLEQSDAVRALGFDETFMRMWHFYLEYSRAGFQSGYIGDYQLTFSREDGA